MFGEREHALSELYPQIPWREPIPVSVAGSPVMLCCRFCIAFKGLSAREVVNVGFEAEADFEQHFEAEHDA